VGTRMPSVLPQRITPALVRIFQKAHPLYLMVHFNHSAELTPESKKACALLAHAGIPMENQTVLLRGVNDDPDAMADLARGLLRMRVRPYYLHHMDLARGTRHFRMTIDSGIHIMEALRGRISGLAIPTYVVDLPGGAGKIPLTPDYCVRRTEDGYLFRNGRGEVVAFPEIGISKR